MRQWVGARGLAGAAPTTAAPAVAGAAADRGRYRGEATPRLPSSEEYGEHRLNTTLLEEHVHIFSLFIALFLFCFWF